MPKPRRVLFVVNEALFFTTHRIALAKALQARGFEVHIASPAATAPVQKLLEASFVWHDIPLIRSGMAPGREIRLALALFRLLQDLKPDLVHNVSAKPVIWGGIACRLLGIPAVHAITGLGYLFIAGKSWQQSLIKFLFRLALMHKRSRTIFQNQDDRFLFISEGLVRWRRTALIPGGVDLQKFAYKPDPPEGRPVVLFPARLIRDKGLREFVDAAAMVKRRGSDARFVLVGRLDSDNPTAVSEALIQEWQCQGWVEWIGYLGNMPEVLAMATIVCLPSYREGMPRALLEACAVGRPIVATDVPGCRDAVRDGVDGYLVPVRDSIAIADAVLKLLDDPACRERMGRNARQRAEERFTERKAIDQTLALYSGLVNA